MTKLTEEQITRAIATFTPTNYVSVIFYFQGEKVAHSQAMCGGHDSQYEAIECAELARPAIKLLAEAQQAINPEVVVKLVVMRLSNDIEEVVDLRTNVEPRRET